MYKHIYIYIYILIYIFIHIKLFSPYRSNPLDEEVQAGMRLFLTPISI